MVSSWVEGNAVWRSRDRKAVFESLGLVYGNVLNDSVNNNCG